MARQSRSDNMYENSNSQSLMSVLNRFVDAVNAMDDKVMVPSRLRDMELSEVGCNIDASEENNNMALLPVSTARGEDLYSYYEMINAVKGELISGKGPKQTQVSTLGGAGRIDSGLGQSDGESDTLSEDSYCDDGTSDQARKTAQMFRHHLQGLFGLLHQLTDTANFLGDAYEQQIGAKKPKKFAI